MTLLRNHVLMMGLVLGLGTASVATAQQSTTTPVLTTALPDFAGKEVTISTVLFPPGVASAPHRHDAHTFVYVLEGSVVMQVAGGPVVTLGPGQTFYETPTDIHATSKNASGTAPAKILVFMIKNQGAPALRPAN
jgi:quercetin dioxygenase-like cupin family protein